MLFCIYNICKPAKLKSLVINLVSFHPLKSIHNYFLNAIMQIYRFGAVVSAPPWKPPASSFLGHLLLHDVLHCGLEQTHRAPDTQNSKTKWQDDCNWTNMQLINQHKFTMTYRTRAEHARKTVCEETKSRVDVTQTGILSAMAHNEMGWGEIN